MMIRTSLFNALGVNGWNMSSQFSGLAISVNNPRSFAIDGTVEWQPEPGFDPERIQWAERQRTVAFEPTTSALMWLLATESTSPHQVGVIERVATLLEVDALDGDGLPLTTFVLDGQEIFNGVLEHPIPGFGELSIGWRLRQEDYTYFRVVGAIDAVPYDAVPGNDVVPPWSDDVYGWNARYWDQLQIVYPAGYRVRLWVLAQADFLHAWRIRAKGRMGGYAQARGGRDSAGRSARVRS
jgi:hypothetical protein